MSIFHTQEVRSSSPCAPTIYFVSVPDTWVTVHFLACGVCKFRPEFLRNSPGLIRQARLFAGLRTLSPLGFWSKSSEFGPKHRSKYCSKQGLNQRCHPPRISASEGSCAKATAHDTSAAAVINRERRTRINTSRFGLGRTRFCSNCYIPGPAPNLFRCLPPLVLLVAPPYVVNSRIPAAQ